MDILNNAIKYNIHQQEKIIKEIALQGYKYLAIRREYVTEDNTMKCNIKYQGLHSTEGIGSTEENGIEIFDLTEVINYLHTANKE